MKKRRLKAALAPLYLKLYEDVAAGLKESLEPMVKEVARIIGETADVYLLPVIREEEDAARLKEVCEKEDIDCVITLHISYSPSLLTAGVLAGLGKPILMIDTTFDEGFDAMSDTYLLKNHGIHGVMDLAAVLRSMGVNYMVCAGYYREKAFVQRLKWNLNILFATARFAGQKIAITGKPFDKMGDFAVDFGWMKEKFGHVVVEIGEDEIKHAMEGVDEDEVESIYLEEIRSCLFDGDPENLKTNIRQYLAFKKMFEAEGITAYTMNFVDFDKTPVPFYAVGRMMADSVGYAGEGDVLTATLGLPLNILAEKAAFSEFFCPDWKDGLLIMSHMGEADPRFAQAGGKVSIQAKTALGKTLPSYYYKFNAQPMELTYVTWTKNTDGGRRLLSGKLTCIEHPLLEELGAPHFIVKPKKELHEFLTEYSMNGGGHHLYVAKGDILSELRLFARLAGADFDFLD